MNLRLSAFLASAVLSAPFAAEAQEPLLRVTGPSTFGYSADAADIDGDGVSDILAGSATGDAWVHSGADGSLLFSMPAAGGVTEVACAGDVNGDGVLDVVVGIWKSPEGQARVHSGVDGALIHKVFGSAGTQLFGSAVAGVGDVDGDGFDDFAVGNTADSPAYRGRVLVFSGKTAGVLFTSFGLKDDEQFGGSISPAGDVDNDGTPDIIVGCRDETLSNGPGRVRVISGANGSAIHEYAQSAEIQLGHDVGDLGDIDGDGFDDFMFTSRNIGILPPQHDVGGRIRVVSGQTGTDLFNITGDEIGHPGLGSSCSRAGDVDGDGTEDFASYSMGNLNVEPAICVFSGATGALIRAIPASVSSTSVPAPLAHGDFDGDGHGDLAHGAFAGFFDNSASVVVFSGETMLSGLYEGTGGAVALGVEVGGTQDDLSVRLASPGDALVFHVDAPGLEAAPLVLAAQPFLSANGMPANPGLSLWFDLNSLPTVVILFDSANNVFGIPSLPSGGVSIYGGVVPPGLAGTSVAVQAVSLAGPLAANGLYEASGAVEIRLK